MRSTYFCMPDADLLTPRHSKISNPVVATDTKKRVRVNRTTTARHGGSRPRADFQFSSPLDIILSIQNEGRVEQRSDSGAFTHTRRRSRGLDLPLSKTPCRIMVAQAGDHDRVSPDEKVMGWGVVCGGEVKRSPGKKIVKGRRRKERTGSSGLKEGKVARRIKSSRINQSINNTEHRSTTET